MKIRFINRSVLIIALALILTGAVVFNSAWAQTGTITGRVTNTGGTVGLGNVRVYVYDAYGAPTTTPTTFVTTNSNGDYTLTLSPGNYKLNIFPPTGAGFYVAEWYNDTYLSAKAQMITLSAGQNIPNINASLASGGRIAGKVTGPSGDLNNITIRAWNTDLSPAFSGRTDTSGNYNIPVPAGTYRLQFDPTTPSPGQNFVIEFYNDKKDMKTADTVTVTAGQTTTPPVSAQLAAPQTLTISGCIRDGSSAPISGVVINGLDNSPVTDVNGCYTGTVNFGWGCYTGWITPLKGDTIFSPPFKEYSCVSGNQNDQNYTGTIPSNIVYYDQFANLTIDPQKWETNQVVREIVDGRLVSKTTAYESTVQNRLYFKNPEAITYFEADVAINEVEANYGPVAPNIITYPQATLLGVYYNAATGTPGSFKDDVSAQVRIRSDQGQLLSEWKVLKYTVDDGSAWEILGEGSLSSSLNLRQFYKLSINWDQGTKTFTFGDGVATPQQHTVSGPTNPPQNVTRFLRSGVLIVQDESHFVTEPSLWGRVSAAFDNALAKDGSDNTLMTDNFSSTPLNANNWDSQEIVREIRSGALFSQTRGVDSAESISNSLSIKNPEHVNGIQAKVTLAAYQNPNRASAQARLSGYFFNDTGDPNSGYQGETYAFVEIISDSSTIPAPIARWVVMRFNDPNATIWKWTVHQSGTFPVTISPGVPHILGLKWDGVLLSFKFDDYVAHFTPFTPIFPSNMKAKQLRTQIMPAGASVPPYAALIEATFDDVRIGVMNLLYLPLILKN